LLALTEHKISPDVSYTKSTPFKGAMASSVERYPATYSKFEVVENSTRFLMPCFKG